MNVPVMAFPGADWREVDKCPLLRDSIPWTTKGSSFVLFYDMPIRLDDPKIFLFAAFIAIEGSILVKTFQKVLKMALLFFFLKLAKLDIRLWFCSPVYRTAIAPD